MLKKKRKKRSSQCGPGNPRERASEDPQRLRVEDEKTLLDSNLDTHPIPSPIHKSDPDPKLNLSALEIF